MIILILKTFTIYFKSHPLQRAGCSSMSNYDSFDTFYKNAGLF